MENKELNQLLADVAVSLQALMIVQAQALRRIADALDNDKTQQKSTLMNFKEALSYEETERI